MTETGNPTEIFSRKRRRVVRDRAYNRANGNDFLHLEMADEIFDRLNLVSRTFGRCLILGLGSKHLKERLESQNISCFIADPSMQLAISNNGVQCDEDRLPFADASFDLVISLGSLDTVNDLPGALTLVKRALKPDGLLLGSFLGAESLPTLKSALMFAEQDRVATHIHPQIDIRTIGNLLLRAGFALPVADSDTLELKYATMTKLVDDIRNFGGGNMLNGNNVALSKAVIKDAQEQFHGQANKSGKTSEFVELIYISGWAPHPDQPKPAHRGSGQKSLTQVLNNRTQN